MSRENRIPIMLNDTELKAIDDYRFAQRISTRSQAVRDLVRTGLKRHRRYVETTEAMSIPAMRQRVLDDALKEIRRWSAAEKRRLDEARRRRRS